MKKSERNRWDALTRKISFAEFLLMLCFAMRSLSAMEMILTPVGWIQWSLGLRGYLFWDREIQVLFSVLLLFLGSIAGFNYLCKKMGEETLGFFVQALWLLTFGIAMVGAIITVSFGVDLLFAIFKGVITQKTITWQQVTYLLMGVTFLVAGWFGLNRWNEKYPGWNVMRVKKKTHEPKVKP